MKLSKAEWAEITAPLAGKPSSAAREREQIALAVSRAEIAVGSHAGTANDEAGAHMGGQAPGQLDCVDEAINTSKYLTFFAQDNLLDYHCVMPPARRGDFIDGMWPHNTGVVKDNETGAQYAIDSWYGKNGDLPDVVPLQEWLDGWKPR